MMRLQVSYEVQPLKFYNLLGLHPLTTKVPQLFLKIELNDVSSHPGDNTGCVQKNQNANIYLKIRNPKRQRKLMILTDL